MISSHTFKRLEGELELQETKLRNLFTSIFVDDEKAWGRWTREVQDKTLTKALKRITDKPKVFGKMKGRLHLGFLKDKAFEERELARKNLGFQAERWRSAQLQVEQSKAQLEAIVKDGADQPKAEQPKKEPRREPDVSRGR